MDRAIFERRFAELSRAHESSRDNVGCIECARCERCADCTFCVECVGTRRSSYCRACTDCVGCTQCSECAGCTDCQHCVRSTRCLRAAYLVRCVACADCTYCFGCVGLVSKDFHVLNEPYGRTEYFALVAKLQRELGLSTTSRGGVASIAKGAP